MKYNGRNIDVHIKTISPLVEGDKLSGLYGNKAIVSAIIPDDDMPHTKSGERMDMIFSPITVPGRMNIGQIADAAAGKLLAKTTGKPRVIKNFDGSDVLGNLKKELEDNNIPINETMVDGKSGKEFETPIF